MTIRERIEAEECERLATYAAKAILSKGRALDEPPDPMRTCFQRDRDRIIHCKGFRRLKHKTQVFYSPEGDHYRTRLTHTLEVAQIARTISRALRLNEDLTEAIALAHDLGHTPFGHSGEDALNQVVPGGFKHNLQSLRVVKYVERRNGKPGMGLNLSAEVLDGIVCHSADWPKTADTLEGQVVKVADKIAYINHDFDDAVRAGIISETDVPDQAREVLGDTRARRLDTLVQDIVEQSYGRPAIYQSHAVKEAMASLRGFMFDRVYTGSPAKHEGDKAKMLVISLYEYYMANHDELEADSGESPSDGEWSRTVVDYIAGMTDRYAVSQFSRRFMPAPWAVY